MTRAPDLIAPAVACRYLRYLLPYVNINMARAPDLIGPAATHSHSNMLALIHINS